MKKILGVKPLKYVKENGFDYAEINPEYEKKLTDFQYSLALKGSGIPPFYWDINFEDYEGDKNNISYRKMLHYSKNFEKPEFKYAHLFCYGVHSTQKTALAVNILKEAIRKGYKTNFILAGKLLKILRGLESYNIENEYKYIINDLLKSDILLIDDCFDPDKSLMWKKSENKNLIISCWDEFFRDIIVSDTKLILTSNFNIESIKEYYGQSLYELIDRNFVAVEFTESVKAKRKSIVKDIFKDLEL
jgi:DNA replication protein DnaC